MPLIFADIFQKITITADDDIFLKMTGPERQDFVETFSAMKSGLELPNPSYERSAAIQSAKPRVARVKMMMTAAKRRPMPRSPKRRS